LFWQAPTLLNPHFAVGAKDVEGAGIFYEPLAAWDPDGNLVPVLAAEIPDIENGGVAADGMSVTWKLKTGVQWHDGQRRGRRQEHQIALLRKLWEEPVVDHEDSDHRIDRAGILPRPKRQIPIWLGGFSEAAYDRAARIGDGQVPLPAGAPQPFPE
jgi:hypothetical protein